MKSPDSNDVSFLDKMDQNDAKFKSGKYLRVVWDSLSPVKKSKTCDEFKCIKLLSLIIALSLSILTIKTPLQSTSLTLSRHVQYTFPSSSLLTPLLGHLSLKMSDLIARIQEHQMVNYNDPGMHKPILEHFGKWPYEESNFSDKDYEFI